MENEVLNHDKIFHKYMKSDSDIKPSHTRGAFVSRIDPNSMENRKYNDSDEEIKQSKYPRTSNKKLDRDNGFRKSSYDNIHIHSKINVKEDPDANSKSQDNRNLSHEPMNRNNGCFSL